MVAVKIMGNGVTIGFGANQGNVELSVFMPALAYNMMPPHPSAVGENGIL